MRFTGLSIDGFGIYHDETITDLPAGLLVFAGDNESGKSTVLAFVHTVLFGYLDGRSRGKRYEPLRGGQAGGRLLVYSDTDGELTIHRRDGAKGGALRLTDADGKEGGPAGLRELLGATTRSMHQNLYAFSLDELQKLATLTSEDVKEVIYGASLGAGSVSLPEARKQLEAEMAKLFKPGGSTPSINAQLRCLEELRCQGKDARHDTDHFQELAGEMGRIEREIAATAANLASVRVEQKSVSAMVTAWDDWMRVVEIKAELERLPAVDVEFPAGAADEYEQLSDRIAEDEEAVLSCLDRVAHATNELAAIAIDEKLLAHGAAVEDAYAGLSSYEDRQGRLPDLGRRADQLERAIEELLEGIGPNWTEDRAKAIDRSSQVRQQADQWKQDLEDASRDIDRAQDSCRAAKEDLKRHGDALASAKQRKTELAEGLVDVDRRRLDKLHSGIETFAAQVSERPAVEGELKAAQDKLGSSLREIRPDWTVDDLERFDSSIGMRQRVRDLESSLAASDRDRHDQRMLVEQAKTEEQRIETRLKRAREDRDKAGGELLTPAQIQQRKQALRELRRLAGERKAVSGEIELQDRLSGEAAGRSQDSGLGRILKIIALGALILGLLIGGLAAGLGQLWLGVIIGVLLAVTAAALFVWSRRVEPDQSAASKAPQQDGEQLRQKLSALTAQIAGLVTTLGLTAHFDENHVHRLEDELDAARDQLPKATQLADLVKQQAEAAQAFEDSQRKSQQLEAAFAEITAEWEELVGSLGLARGTSPGTALEVCTKVDGIRLVISQIEGLDGRLSRISEAEVQYTALMVELPELSAAARWSAKEKELQTRRLLTKAQQQQETRRKFEASQDEVNNHQAFHKQASERLKEAEDMLAQRQEHYKMKRAECSEWLEALGLDRDWTPPTAIGNLATFAKISEKRRERDDARLSHRDLRSACSDFQTKVQQIFTAIDRSVPDVTILGAELRRLEAERAEQAKTVVRRDELHKQVKGKQQERSDAQIALDRRKKERADLLEAAGAKDFAELSQKARAAQLQQELAGLDRQIRKVCGEKDTQALGARFAEVDSRASLEAREQHLSTCVKDVDESLLKLKNSQGQTEQMMKALLDADRVGKLRALEESSLEKIRSDCIEWARMALTQKLLEEARKRFERDHQPEVIQRAGRYFKAITGGRYESVFVPHGDESRSIEVVKSDGSRLGVEELSTGTAQQLYLSIRFGYVETHRVRGETLPILMDDVLVNFDPTRAHKAASAIAEVAKTHQVLFFTCHPSTVKIFREVQPDVAIYQIEDGAIRAANDPRA